MINDLLERFFNLLPGWLSVLIVLGLSLLALLLAVLLAFLLIRLVLRIRWKSQTLKRFIRLSNQGNVTGGFLVRVDGPSDELSFQCLLDGSVLPPAPVISQSAPRQPRQAPAPAPLPTAAAAPAAASPQPAEDEKRKKMAAAAGKAKEQSKKGLGFVRLFSGIFSSLGSLLPGSVGASFKEKATELQQVSQDAGAKMQLPEQKLKSVEHLKGQVGQLKPGEQTEKPASPQAGKQPVADVAAAAATAQPAAQPAPNSTPGSQEPFSAGFLRTPLLSPGESLCLELRIDPAHTYRSGEYSFSVLARQVESPQSLPQEPLPDLVSRDSVRIVGLSPIYWILSFLMALCAVVVNGTWAVLFVSWLAGLAL